MGPGASLARGTRAQDLRSGCELSRKNTGFDRMELGGRSIGSSAYDRRLGVDTWTVDAVTATATTANATAPARERSRRGAPVVEHAPQHRIGQRHEPAKTSVARLGPAADDEGPQDEEVDVGFSHECLPRPRGPDAVERLAAGEPILLLTDLNHFFVPMAAGRPGPKGFRRRGVNLWALRQTVASTNALASPSSILN